MFSDIKKVKKVIKITSRTTTRPVNFSEVKVLRPKTVIHRAKISKKHLADSGNRIVIKKPQTFKPAVSYRTKLSEKRVWAMPKILPSRYVLGVGLSIFLLLSTYLSGIWTGVYTSRSYAEFVFSESPPALQNQQPVTLQVAALNGLGQITLSSSDENLFVMSIDQLENVFERKRIQMTELLYDQRAEKIKEYLKIKKAPYAEYAGTIARQPHWQLILAISFAESSWGKNCVDNNCSNIGVEPGHALWREYKSYGEWIVDFNRLLERRYKDWTLKEMCGVYVKPCNKNWLLATTQVLGELKEKQIN
jgi:hypothetical protein